MDTRSTRDSVGRVNPDATVGRTGEFFWFPILANEMAGERIPRPADTVAQVPYKSGFQARFRATTPSPPAKKFACSNPMAASDITVKVAGAEEDTDSRNRSGNVPPKYLSPLET